MASSRVKGKSLSVLSTTTTFFLISALLYFHSFSCLVLASDLLETETDSIKQDTFVVETSDCECKDVSFLTKQQNQLENLEELLKNLTHLVSRLESHLPEITEKLKKPTLLDERKEFDKDLTSKEVVESKTTGPVLVTRYNAFWSERFQFVSAVKLSSDPTCLNLLPFRDLDGISKYFAVGDDKGKVYVFSKGGDVSLEFGSFSNFEESSPITNIVSFLLFYKNESVIVTGHENGAIVMHRVWEEFNGEEWSSLHVDRIGRFEVPDGGGSRITILEVHHVGRKRYVLATNLNGQITVFKEDGTLYGTATPRKRPVAFLKQRLLFLTETGAGSLDLRTMKLKESDCEGLDNSVVKSYVFDAIDRSKAYGFASDSSLIQASLLGDAMNFKCRIRSRRSTDSDESLALAAIKGYLLISDRQKVLVYNVSSHQYVRSGGLRHMFSAGLDEIIASFVTQQASDITNGKKTDIPLITSDHEKLIVISLGNGYVAMYRSTLPVFKNEFSSILWTSPVLFFIIFLIGAWHFFANKKEAFTLWGPDDPFTTGSITGGAALGSGSVPGDKSSAESSRNSEIMDLRSSSGLRGPPRRYVSPPRYSGAVANTYRPSSDTDARPAPVDARFRATSEMKYRGANVESGGVPKRRDGLFVNGQVVDDTN